MKLSPIIRTEDLKLLKHDVILIDARSGPGAKEKYTSLHLSKARFVDMENELSGAKENPENGGRHPLPDISKFSQVLEQLGITPGSHVVVYDDKNGANAAARFWWMLRSIGHQKVQVLDGGFQAAVSAGMATSSYEVASVARGRYPLDEWKLAVVGINQVEASVQKPDYLVIDVREAERYRGEKEPIDLIAGHIPGSMNIPYMDNLNKDGFFLSPEELKEKYVKALDDRASNHVFVHCGSGVTACHTLLAMDYAGLPIPPLYVGSWSEWSRTGRPVATEV